MLLAIIVANLFNPLATLYSLQMTEAQCNAPCRTLLSHRDWLWRLFDIEVLWYPNWHRTSFFPDLQVEFCNPLCYVFKHFVRMCYFLGSGHPSTDIQTATLLYIKYFYWTQWYNKYFERRNFFQYYSVFFIMETLK